MNKTTVVNLYKERYDVYIGREVGATTFWGNPFTHRRSIPFFYIPDINGNQVEVKTVLVETVEEAINKYREWIQTQPSLMAKIPDLKGKRLGCFCRPKEGFRGRLLCHGQVLAALADNIEPEEVG